MEKEKQNTFRLKTIYLEQLRAAAEAISDPHIRKGIYDRISKVCDSIERDLEIKPFSVGDLKVNIEIDAGAVFEAIEEQFKKNITRSDRPIVD